MQETKQQVQSDTCGGRRHMFQKYFNAHPWACQHNCFGLPPWPKGGLSLINWPPDSKPPGKKNEKHQGRIEIRLGADWRHRDVLARPANATALLATRSDQTKRRNRPHTCERAAHPATSSTQKPGHLQANSKAQNAQRLRTQSTQIQGARNERQ